MISIFFYFIFYSSAVLVYGAGIRHSVVSSKKSDALFFRILKTLLCIFSSVSICWFLYKTLLVPLHFDDLLFPLLMLCYLPVNACFNMVFKSSLQKSLPEFTVPLLCIILAITQSYTYAQALVIAFSSCISYYSFIPILFAIRKRLEYADPVQEFKTGSLIFISIAVIMISLFSFHISWLPLGGFK